MTAGTFQHTKYTTGFRGWERKMQEHMSYRLNSLKGGYLEEDYKGRHEEVRSWLIWGLSEKSARRILCKTTTGNMLARKFAMVFGMDFRKEVILA